MPLTGDDLRKITLQRSIGGYDRAQVDELIEDVARALEASALERERLEQLLDVAADTLKDARAEHQQLQDEYQQLRAEADRESSVLRQQAETANAELLRLREQHETTEREREPLREEVERLRHELDRERSTASELAQERASLEAELRATRMRAEEAESELQERTQGEARVGRLLVAADRTAALLRRDARAEAERALKLARRNSAKIVAAAETERRHAKAEVARSRAESAREGDAIVAEARKAAEEVVRAAEQERARVEEDARLVERQIADFKARCRDLLLGALAQIGALVEEPTPGDGERSETELVSDLKQAATPPAGTTAPARKNRSQPPS